MSNFTKFLATKLTDKVEFKFAVSDEVGSFVLTARLSKTTADDILLAINENWFGRDGKTCPTCHGIGKVAEL